eukprot:6212609-Pleurochrysis_carterae.AAC.2
MGGVMVDEPIPIETRLAVYSPCNIPSTSMTQPLNPYYDYIGGPFYKGLQYGHFVYGRSYRAYYWGKGSTLMDLYIWGLTIFRQHPSERAIIYVCSERTSYESFRPPIQYPY